jgi:hypothetical protein
MDHSMNVMAQRLAINYATNSSEPPAWNQPRFNPNPLPAYNTHGPPWPHQPPQMNSGYFFAPFVPLTTTPPILDNNSFRRRAGMTGYSREALREGARHYAQISISNFIADDVEEGEKVNWMKEGF